MSELIQRRRLLLSMAALPALGLGLAACTDSNAEAEAEAPATDPVTTAAVEAPPSSGTVDMDKLLEEGALEDKVLGDENAPVTIVEYASMTCSHCATFHTRTYPELKKKYIETGKVRFIMREFPFDPRAEAGTGCAVCAPEDFKACRVHPGEL